MRSCQVIVLVLLCCSVLGQGNNCPNFYDGDLLQSGKNIFMRMRSGGSGYTYQFPVSYPVPAWGLQVATTSSTIGDYNPSSGGFSYLVSGKKKSGVNFVQFSLIANPDQAWSTIAISFLISSKEDFVVGNYQYAANQWARGSSVNTYSVGSNINRNLDKGSYKIAAFISGFSTTDTKFQISINQRAIEKNNKRFTITIFCDANPYPTTIAISVVIYPQNHPYLDISYGAPAGDTGAYQISGPTSFSNSGVIQYNQFRIASRYLACSGNQCQSNCVLQQRCVQLDGNIYQGQCKFCAQGVVFQYGLCTRRCGANQLYTSRVCVCLNGYTRKGKDCVKKGQLNCGKNQILWNNNCRKCPFDASPDSSQRNCVCNNGGIYNENSNSCSSRCGSGEQSDSNGRCVCLPQYGRYGGNCRQCPSETYSNDRQECVCSSGYNFNSQTGRCEVINNCPYPFISTPQGCACPAGSIKFNNQCRECPNGASTNNAQSNCICNNGQTYDINSNSCSTRCASNQVLYNGKCVCNGYVVSRQCRRCPSNAKPNFQQNTCICPAGFNFDSFNNNCISTCKASQTLVNGRCQCINGYYRYNNVCKACPKSAVASDDDTTCICTSDKAIYIANSNLCIQCGANSIPNSQKTSCICASGFVPQGKNCVPVVRCQFNEDFVDGQCKCKYGWIRVGPTCVQACGINQYYDGKNCFCKEGYAKFNSVCQQCRGGSIPNGQKTACLCNDPLQFYDFQKGQCVNCPANSVANSDDTDCNCKPGYQKQNGQCNSICPAQSSPNANGQCICSGGKILSGNQCITPLSCPDRATFNAITKACVCNSRNQNIIDGVCKSCDENSSWVKDKCVCNTGFFKIGGVCRICDARTKYDGQDCICNWGYFGNRDLCTACHPSCSQCTGAQANQCKSCSDVSLVLEKGYCSKNSPCGFGLFLDNGQCTKCLDNCINCQNIFECKNCAIGYKTFPQNVNGQNVVSCDQICGDGIKFEQQCDDGNNNNGDGCNNKCQQQPGWFCSGGSSKQPSICKKFIPDQIQLSSKGAVNMGGYVLVSIRASYLPSCITQNQCNKCFSAITANVLQVNVPVNVIVNFIPLSQWQWIVKIDFNGNIVTSAFKLLVKLNPTFKGCFADQDYNQQLELTVDPAFLAIYDQVGTLSLNPNVIQVPKIAERNLGIEKK